MAPIFMGAPSWPPLGKHAIILELEMGWRPATGPGPYRKHRTRAMLSTLNFLALTRIAVYDDRPKQIPRPWAPPGGALLADYV